MNGCSSSILKTLRLKNPKLLLLESCSNLSDLKIIHGHMVRTHLVLDVFVTSRLIALCVGTRLFKNAASSLVYALKVFSQVPSPNLFMYNALIRGCSDCENPERSMALYIDLCRLGLVPDNLTFTFLIKSCTRLFSLVSGSQSHCQALKRGFDGEVHVQNALLHMYSSLEDVQAAGRIFRSMKFLDVVSWTTMISGFCKCGDVGSARRLFDRMPERNMFTWSVMINGYTKAGRFEEAIELFELLQQEGVKASETVMVSVVSSCGHLGALELAERAYNYLIRNCLSLNMTLGTAVVEMYARCGSINKATRVFEELQERDALTYTAVIAGFAMHGHAQEALHYFSKMLDAGIVPRDITFTAILSACSHGGLVGKGKEIFDNMKRVYGIEPRLEHYGCMVDLLGRAGKLEEAEKFVLEMPVKPNAPIWGALIGACRIHRNAKIAERVGKILIQLLPEHSGYYVLLSNIYAKANNWEGVNITRGMMKDKGVKKEPGCSAIEINGKMHRFVMGDKSHPDIHKIEKKWEEIVMKIRLVGYTGNTDEALFDIDEEEKESALHRHSEKLAIAYGIMKIGAGAPIRIVKNLRVCEDCHRATKLISKVFDRELIVRDRNRFHHFEDGACSCLDFW
ncbi:hypothetical protein ACJRO7_002541 [Eucalyptus globulus]|uniref:DYW domain-containing protein n=1 Tax=Eucalyptus globulus TaxID=34317 RepID=A0ABD3M4L4_EUCGL